MTCKGHWGAHGAAGVLAVSQDRGHVLLVQRGRGVKEPGTWAWPGGSRHEDETFEAAAAREFGEETGHHPDPADLTPLAVDVCDGCGWRYVTFRWDTPGRFDPRPGWEHAWETETFYWADPPNADDLDWHPVAGKTWARLRHDAGLRSSLPA